MPFHSFNTEEVSAGACTLPCLVNLPIYFQRGCYLAATKLQTTDTENITAITALIAKAL
jgi:hypothetical protein